MANVVLKGQTRPVAIGLAWHVLPGATSERKEIDALCRAEGTPIGCVLTNEDEGSTVVGLCAERKEAVACGAAWLAEVSDRSPLVLVEELADGRYWLCAVRAGLPVPGLDVVIARQDLFKRLDQFRSESPDSKLCSTVEDVQGFASDVSAQSFAELVGNSKPPRVRRVSGISSRSILLGVVAIVGVGGWYGFDAYSTYAAQQENKAKLQAIQAEQARDAAQRADAERATRVAAARAKISEVVLARPTLGAMVNAAMDSASVAPVVVAGWHLSGFDCGALSCSLSWECTSLGTALSFLEAAERMGWRVTDQKPQTATTEMAVSAQARSATIDDLAESGAFRLALLTRVQELQRMGMEAELPEPQPVEVSLAGGDPALGGDPAASPAASGLPGGAGEPLPWKTGTVTLKGSKLYEIRGIPEFLEHPGVAFTSLKVDLKMNQWNMVLSYASR